MTCAVMAEDKIDKAITEFFAALKELGELRHRYDSVIANVNDYYVYFVFSNILRLLTVSGYSLFST